MISTSRWAEGDIPIGTTKSILKAAGLEVSTGVLVPVPINEKTRETYQELKRFNVIFPSRVLKAVDDYRRIEGLKRSTFLQKAAEEYLRVHQ